MKGIFCCNRLEFLVKLLFAFRIIAIKRTLDVLKTMKTWLSTAAAFPLNLKSIVDFAVWPNFYYYYAYLEPLLQLSGSRAMSSCKYKLKLKKLIGLFATHRNKDVVLDFVALGSPMILMVIFYKLHWAVEISFHKLFNQYSRRLQAL